MTTHRAVLLLVLLALPASAAVAAGTPALVERLPGGAQVVGFVDASAFRASPVVAGLEWESLLAAGGLQSPAVGAWSDFQMESLDRVAFGGWGRGGGYDVVMLAEGRWEAETLKASLLKAGGVEIQVAGRSAWKLPADEKGAVLVVTPLEENLLAISSYDLAASVHGGGGPLPSDLAGEVAALPAGLSSWVVLAEPARVGGQTAGLARGLRTLGLWLQAGDTMRIGATALAADAASASQLGSAVQFGLVALSGRAGETWSELARGLRFESAGERLNLGLELNAEQLAALVRTWSATAAEAAGPPSGSR